MVGGREDWEAGEGWRETWKDGGRHGRRKGWVGLKQHYFNLEVHLSTTLTNIQKIFLFVVEIP